MASSAEDLARVDLSQQNPQEVERFVQEAILTFAEMSDHDKGDTQANAIRKEQREKAKAFLINYFKHTGRQFIPCGDRFLVYSKKTKPVQINADFSARVAHTFYNDPKYGTLRHIGSGADPSVKPEATALNFRNLIVDLSNQLGDTKEDISLRKTKPVGALMNELALGSF